MSLTTDKTVFGKISWPRSPTIGPIVTTPTGSADTARRTDIRYVTDRIREAIFHGELFPNQRLVEADLCEQFGAARATVRSALVGLESEGVVERIPNRGARVRAVPIEEALEITEVRGAIEALCAAKAAELITDAQIAELTEIGAAMSRDVAEGNITGYSQQNQLLHQRIIHISGQRTAAATIARLHGQSVRYQYRLWAQNGRPETSLGEHLAIIEAVCAKDPHRAREIMLGHMHSIGQAIDTAGQGGITDAD